MQSPRESPMEISPLTTEKTQGNEALRIDAENILVYIVIAFKQFKLITRAIVTWLD